MNALPETTQTGLKSFYLSTLQDRCQISTVSDSGSVDSRGKPIMTEIEGSEVPCRYHELSAEEIAGWGEVPSLIAEIRFDAIEIKTLDRITLTRLWDEVVSIPFEVVGVRHSRYGVTAGVRRVGIVSR